MRPILFRWRGRSVHSYHVLLYLGMVSAVVAGNHVARRAGLNPDGVTLAMLLLTIPALVGARLLFVSTHWESYRRERRRIWRRSDGGLSVYGGLLAVLVSAPIVSSLNVPFAAFWDVAVFSILIGMVLGRFGCLLNGCCAGKPCERPGALRLPGEDGVWRRRIPTQILEIVRSNSEHLILNDGRRPVFSPNSTRIAFVRGGRIWTCDANGSNQQPLTPGPNDNRPSWNLLRLG